MNKKNLKRFMYGPATPLGTAIGDLYRREDNICLVCDKSRVLLGILTLSDIKRAVQKGADPSTPISAIMNQHFVSAPKGTSPIKLKSIALRATSSGERSQKKTPVIDRIPIVDSKKRLVDLYILPSKKVSWTSTVLVTGGAGYMGSILCRYLLEENYRVIVLDKLIFGDESIRDLYSNKNFSLVRGDTADIGTLIKVLQSADYVVHLAGIVGDPACALDPLQTMEVNHFATKALVDLCQHYQVSRFIFASSCSVYGASPSLLNEKSTPHPVSLYAQSKLYSERELLRAKNKMFHPVILRFGTLYGRSPRMRFDLVVNTMTAHAYFNKQIRVDGGAQWRPLVHVDDAARALLAALQAPLEKVSGEIFNVGDSNENYRISDIASAVQHQVPGTKILNLDTVKDRRDYHVSFAKIRHVLKFRLLHTLTASVGDIIKEFKKGKFRDWKKDKYNNYLTLHSILEKSL